MASLNATTAEDYFTVDSLTENELERLFAKIVADPVTGCWNWTGCTGGRGYGQIKFRRRMVYLHRLMYALVFAPLPNGRGGHIPTVDHGCENLLYCNPFHLQLLSQRDNILKGNSIGAAYARRTHCKHGHPLDGMKSAGRYCKTCNRASAKAYLERKRAAQGSLQSGTGAK
jgi:hypothetical protein